MKQVVIITGAGKGLGKALAIGLSRAGYIVVASGRQQNQLNELSLRLEGQYLTVVCDISNTEACKSLINSVMKKFGTIDVLINNAGVYEESSFADATVEKIKEVYDTVVTGTAQISKLALGEMIKNQSGQIISILDVTAQGQLPPFRSKTPLSIDLSAKLAKTSLTDVLRRETELSGITTTSFFLRWVASRIDIDDNRFAPKGATHPKDAVEQMILAIQNKVDKVEVQPSRL